MGTHRTSPLARLERWLTDLIEGAVERRFRAGVQPVHLARKLEAAMEDGALVGVSGPVAPNHYVVLLAPADYQRFAGAAAGVQRDLERHLALAAARRNLRSHDPFLVELQADPAQQPGRITVRPAFLPRTAARPDATAGHDLAARAGSVEHTQVMPVALKSAAAPEAVLEVAGGEGEARVAPLRDGRCTIGRADGNDLVLPESSVSRQHALVKRQGSGFVVEDLGSTNGVLLNGKPVKSGPLKDGDRLQIGTTALVFRIRHPAHHGAVPATV